MNNDTTGSFSSGKSGTTPTPSTPVRSSLLGDPDMGELIGLFVQDLPRRVEELRHESDAANWSGVKRVAHQLKGASAGYGFACVGELAGELEQRAIRTLTSSTEQDIKKTIEQVNQLIALCQRVQA